MSQKFLGDKNQEMASMYNNMKSSPKIVTTDGRSDLFRRHMAMGVRQKTTDAKKSPKISPTIKKNSPHNFFRGQTPIRKRTPRADRRNSSGKKLGL